MISIYILLFDTNTSFKNLKSSIQNLMLTAGSDDGVRNKLSDRLCKITTADNPPYLTLKLWDGLFKIMVFVTVSAQFCAEYLPVLLP